jgi:TRAP-type C4-dicarboxylate transport system permease large subunit
MPNVGLAEIYFIAGMMTLILIICTVAVYFFIKTYKKEMREKELRKKAKELKKQETEVQK